jgi:hypothetical protein
MSAVWWLARTWLMCRAAERGAYRAVVHMASRA